MSVYLLELEEEQEGVKMHAAVQILMEEQGEQGPSETVQAITDEPRFVLCRCLLSFLL